MQNDVRASPRLMAVAAIALVAAAIMAFTWLSGGNVAGAAGTTASPTAAQTQADDNDGPRNGHDCPKEGHGDGDGQGTGGGSSQQAAPSGTSSGSEL